MKKLISVFLTAVMLASVLFALPVSAAEKETSSVDLAKAIGYGWNLGNTMEACGSWINGSTVNNYETAWGAPTTTKESIAKIAEYGFGAVRIPVAWSNMMSTDGKYTINAELMKRVDEIIGYVIDSGMYAIVNIHWDGGWWDDFGGDEKTSAEAMKKYKAIWKQLAKNYESIGDKLILESSNEELGGFGLPSQEGYDKVNEINQVFVDTVRGAGGENESRYLLIAGYNTGIDPTCNAKFVMPTDAIKNHLLISVHYYTPSTYCIAETEDNSWGYLDSWGTESDKQDMWNELAKMTKFTDAGYGVVVGEYGVAKKKTSDGKVVTKDGTDVFIDTMLSMALQLGYVPCLWDVGNTENNCFDRRKLCFAEDAIGAVFEQYAGKKDQKIIGISSSYVKNSSSIGKGFSLSAFASGGGKLSYTSSDTSVATVSSTGRVTLKGSGKASITVTAAAKGDYRETSKIVTVIVRPVKAVIKSAESLSVGKVKVMVLRGDSGLSGMEIAYSTSAKMTDSSIEKVVFGKSYSDYTSRAINKLDSGDKYYFRVRYYIDNNGKKYYGSWSSVKSSTVK